MASKNHLPPDLRLPNGVVVKGNIRINELTLREHRDRLAWAEKFAMSRETAQAAGYSEDEIAKEFDKATTAPPASGLPGLLGGLKFSAKDFAS